MGIDITYRDRRLAARLEDPEFRTEYERAQREISQIDSLMQMLDDLREAAGKSKAQLARDIDKNPASIRRLFTSEANPELKTIVAIAEALDAEVIVKPRRRSRRRAGTRVAA
jgi:DNA-binding phage protein